MSSSSSPMAELDRRLKRANQEFEETLDIMALLDSMASSSNQTQRLATLKDKKHTLNKIVELHGTYTGEPGTEEHLAYVLSYRDQVEQGHMELGRGTTRQIAEREFKDILTKCIALENAALVDRTHLLNKAFELMGSYTGESRSREQRAFLLANQVYSRLTDLEVDEIPQLNEFESRCSIGKGSFGVVNQGRWLGVDCVLKQIFNDPNNSEDRNEAKSLKRFSHPHIVKFYRHWVAVPGEHQHLSAQSHIVMERMPMDLGQLIQKLKKNGPSSSSSRVGEKRKSEETPPLIVPFSVAAAIDVMLQLAKAMWHMHSKGVVHRDLKPGNVLVRPVSREEVPELSAQGYVQVKLGDFGLVRENMLSTHSQLLMSQFAGSTLYRAPELSSLDFVKEGEKKLVQIKYPHKADLWSFGVMSAEILSGARPFDEGQLRSTLLVDIQNGVRPRIPEGCPDYLRFCIESCWQYEPLERPRFSDIWRMLRIANLRSLGLVHQNYDWFMFKEGRDQVVGLASDSGSPRSSRSPIPQFIRPARTPNSSARLSKTNSVKVALSFLKLKIFGSPKLIPNNGLGIHSVSPHEQPFGFLTNQVWPLEDISDWKVDVILFEGNVGGRQQLSCRDTWLQRSKPNVFWPRDWLPQDVHRDIRVLVLEYSISDTGLELLVNDIKKFLIFSDRWNQKHTWQRPIVLVGHSLGCTVIEALVVDLDRNASQLVESSISDYDKKRAETSRAFLNSLAGCFFYAHPSQGLVRIQSQSLLKEVFGGLSYSDALFEREFWDGSERLKKRSEDFMNLTRTPRSRQISLMALIEGRHTRGRKVVPKNPIPELTIEHSLVLEDSNHIDICKPVDKKHISYQSLVKFLKEHVPPEHPEG